jgi:hypothetical protein
MVSRPTSHRQDYLHRRLLYLEDPLYLGSVLALAGFLSHSLFLVLILLMPSIVVCHSFSLQEKNILPPGSVAIPDIHRDRPPLGWSQIGIVVLTDRTIIRPTGSQAETGTQINTESR